jgi:multidrug efflux system membrane fusion protein
VKPRVRHLSARSPLLLFAALCAADLACQTRDPGATSATQPRREAPPVSVAVVSRQDLPVELNAFGSVEANSTVSVAPQVSGLITEVHFQEGSFVKRGDLLFTIDTRPYRASLAAAQAELAKNQALAAQAETEAQRSLELESQGLLSAQGRLKAAADAASARAMVKADQAQIQGARLNVDFTRITAPIDGMAGSLLVHAGNLVHAGSPDPLVVLRSMSPVQVRFAVPQSYLGQIRQKLGRGSLLVRATPRAAGNGRSADEIRVGAGAQGAAGTEGGAGAQGSAGNQSVEGQLTFMENSVDSATGTLSVKATFPNTGLELWPGAAVDVVLVLEVAPQVVVAPAAAVQAGQNGTYAFVLESGDTVVLRPVTLARSTANWAWIASGLEPGEQVVIDGQVRLRSGMKVAVQSTGDARASADTTRKVGLP